MMLSNDVTDDEERDSPQSSFIAFTKATRRGGSCSPHSSFIILSAKNDGRGFSVVGDKSGGGTPGPISNPAVKPASADGSVRFGACESRSLPTHSVFLLTCFF